MDAIEEVAEERLRELAADLQVQLEKGTGMRPAAWMLAQARKKAAKAVVLFLDVDVEDTKLVRRLQGELKLYDDMVTACQALVARGKEADYRITESDRAALDEVVMQMTPEERRLHKLEPIGKD
jgi:hypothetical protein